ncbi:hypothetical protein B0H19DRAFT_1075573 [Mycena capillaripes]|nr:hypothetical protein B0H19DRAFT_1075573 [Mycena capillaripes]
MASPPETRSRRRKRENDDDHESISAQLPAKRLSPANATAPPATGVPRTSNPPRENAVVETLVKDAQFFREDGNCILRVVDTLFKVHRHYLCPANEETGFTGLFALPIPGAAPEGQGDERPIKLEGDSVDQVRAFFGYAYSSPLQLGADRISDGDLQKLIDTARFAHKYQLQSFEDWSKDTITKFASRNDEKALRKCPPALYIH